MPANLLSQEEIRDRFRLLMDRLKWSQTETAEKLLGDRAKQPDVNKWLRLERPIPRKYQAAIAAEAGESMAYFLPNTDADAERRDKLAVAKWLEDAAQRIRAELEPIRPPGASTVPDPNLARDAEGRAARGKKGPKRGRGTA